MMSPTRAGASSMGYARRLGCQPAERGDLPGVAERKPQRLAAGHRLEVVPGAGHLFGEPGALDEVARLAAAWFVTWLRLNAGRGMRAARAPGLVWMGFPSGR
jgi:hypothetical protein